jgi:hypothetical protein
LPKYKGWGDVLRWSLQENVPGEFPYTAGLFPFKREGEDPTRMFAGEGGPERTNRRFHYVSLVMPAKMLSTAFDSVTLYGNDPHIRPDIYGKIDACVRYRDNDYPMGFVDDDAIVHIPKKIHSIRVPRPEGHQKVKVLGVRFLHVSYLRPRAQRAKYRFYMVKENLLGTSPWYRRRRRYRAPNHLLPWATVEPVPSVWTQYPAYLMVDLSTITDTDQSWHNIEVLEAFNQFGSLRFSMDDIWDNDWNSIQINTDLNKGKIIRHPPRFLKWLLKLSDKFNK